MFLLGKKRLFELRAGVGFNSREPQRLVCGAGERPSEAVSCGLDTPTLEWRGAVLNPIYCYSRSIVFAPLQPTLPPHFDPIVAAFIAQLQQRLDAYVQHLGAEEKHVQSAERELVYAGLKIQVLQERVHLAHCKVRHGEREAERSAVAFSRSGARGASRERVQRFEEGVFRLPRLDEGTRSSYVQAN